VPEDPIPGVFVEETSFQSAQILPVGTTITCFVGLANGGPQGVSARLTSVGEFEALYGGLDDLTLNGTQTVNYLAHAVRGFFGNGGRELFVARAAEPSLAAYQVALDQTLALHDISILAAPGASTLPDAAAIYGALITHTEQAERFRFAVLDAPPGPSISDVLAFRTRFDSKHAALYYPWLEVTTPTGTVNVPPSGHVCGVYVRTDTERGVHKAPANELIAGIAGFSTAVNKQQEILNPQGINVVRFFEGRGNRVWGARTLSSDPEWKYVNLRRYFNYLERSISRGIQWSVFEPNGERLWSNVRRTI
jgi:Phage tail sheath protein subtilisin-like domain/Phage tail sheath C-terminal domain